MGSGMAAKPKPGSKNQRHTSALGAFTYSVLIGLLLGFLILYSFRMADLRADRFTMYLISLLFVLLLLPIAYYVKIFDVVEVRRDVNALKKQVNEQRIMMQSAAWKSPRHKFKN